MQSSDGIGTRLRSGWTAAKKFTEIVGIVTATAFVFEVVLQTRALPIMPGSDVRDKAVASFFLNHCSVTRGFAILTAGFAAIVFATSLENCLCL